MEILGQHPRQSALSVDLADPPPRAGDLHIRYIFNLS